MEWKCSTAFGENPVLQSVVIMMLTSCDHNYGLFFSAADSVCQQQQSAL
jgi:hypothetical protein